MSDKQRPLPGCEGYAPDDRDGEVRPFDDLTTREVQRIYGVTRQALDNWRSAGCPGVTKVDGQLHWDLTQVAPWRRERDMGIHGEDAVTLGGGGDSEALERLRNLKADRERLKLEEERGKLIRVDETTRQLRRVFGALNREIEAICRVHPSAGKDVRESVDRAKRQALKEVTEDE